MSVQWLFVRSKTKTQYCILHEKKKMLIYSKRNSILWEKKDQEEVTFLFSHPNDVSWHVMRHGIFEASLIDWCKQFMRSDGVFLDIGAHCGTYAVHLSSYCKEVHAFECQEKTFYQLCGSIALSQKTNVRAHQVALCDKNNTTNILHVVSADGGGSSMCTELVPYLSSNQEDIKQERVSCRTLDSYKLDNICFIKMDVEGSELEVLKGGLETLDRNHCPSILFEAWKHDWYNAKRKQIFDLLKLIGYNKIMPVSGTSNMFLATKTQT